MKPRKIPLRRCTGCYEMKNKKELLRVVRDDEGNFSVDFTGKKSGRGAYCCPNMECFAKARKTKGFERSFKSQVPQIVYDNLEREIMEHINGQKARIDA